MCIFFNLVLPFFFSCWKYNKVALFIKERVKNLNVGGNQIHFSSFLHLSFVSFIFPSLSFFLSNTQYVNTFFVSFIFSIIIKCVFYYFTNTILAARRKITKGKLKPATKTAYYTSNYWKKELVWLK